jgi:polysaccharide export outer membrane protein
MRRNFLPSLILCALVVGLGCAHLGQFVWVDDYKDPSPPPGEGDYVVGAGDVLLVRVFNQEAISGKTKVRSDGKITLPLLNDVEAAGHTPAALSQVIQTKFKEFINSPSVIVSVEESRQLQVSVLGEVTKPGLLQLESGAGVLQALAGASGMTEFAHRDRIFVLRNDDAPQRIRFSYEMLSRGGARASTFRLRTGDVVVVE